MKACKPSMIDRRNFIRRSALAAVGSSSFSALTTQFNLAHAQVGGADDYRALVCVFSTEVMTRSTCWSLGRWASTQPTLTRAAVSR